ncbi:MAG: NUDIX domain-containing protein [Flavobacteriales bacterium]|nr:NUDIX domain-containing protein [Flavobacteriales bacterium]
MKIDRFNVRVYFLIVEEDQILLSDEILGGKNSTKFPGGGLEYGEGLIEAAQREALEELGQEIEVLEHFYTTDFFIASRFRPTDQIISVYYFAKLRDEVSFRLARKKYDWQRHEEREESFRWQAINTLTPDDMTFETDAEVVRRLRDIS